MNNNSGGRRPLPFAEDLLERVAQAGADGYRIIEAFVDTEKEEDLWSDFVIKADPTNAALDDVDKRNLAKALSGFAHSDGGVLVWGIVAKKSSNDPESADVARSISPIQNVLAFQTNLNDFVSRATKPIVPNVLNIRIERPDRSGYVVTYVPAADHPPYRADICNNNFYKRSGSSFFKLEPYDIRDLILRERYPKLQMDHDLHQVSRIQGMSFYELVLTITNRGPATVNDWKLVLECSNAIVYGENPPAIPYRGNLLSHASEQFTGSDTGVWRRWTLQTTLLANRGSCILLPEDTVVLLGDRSLAGFKAFFILSDEVHDQGGRPIRWRFYSNNAPHLSNEIMLS